MDGPGNIVAEAAAQRRADEMRAVPQPDTAHGVRNLLDAVQPPAMPETGRGMRDAGMPDHGRLAEPDASASMAPLASEHERIGGRIEPRHLEASIEPEPAGFLRPALAGTATTAQPSPAHGTEAVPQPAVQPGGGRGERERQPVAMPRQAAAAVQRVAAERAGTGVEAAAGAPVNVAPSAPGAAENPSAEQREAAMADSIVSRPVMPAPAAMDVPPARDPAPGRAAAPDAGPQVHIGHIDIVVLAPEQARPQQLPLSASADLASRHYLRRL